MSSRIFELLGEVLVKFDQNAPNLLRRDVRLIQLGINRHKNDVCGRSEVVYQAIARTFAFLNITVLYQHLEYGVVHLGCMVAYNLTRFKNKYKVVTIKSRTELVERSIAIL